MSALPTSGWCTEMRPEVYSALSRVCLELAGLFEQLAQETAEGRIEPVKRDGSIARTTLAVFQDGEELLTRDVARRLGVRSDTAAARLANLQKRGLLESWQSDETMRNGVL